MTIRISRVIALLPVGLSISICTTAAVAGAEIRFRPVWGSDNVICMPGGTPCGDTEIMLFEGGVEVTLFVEISGWDADQDGDPTLGAYEGTLNSDTLVGGDPSGVGTVAGFDLTGLGQPNNRFLGVFAATKVCHPDVFFCSDNLNCMTDPNVFLSDCGSNVGSAPCPLTYPFCIDRPDYVYRGLAILPHVTTAGPDYSWSAASVDCRPDPDGTMFFYGGTLVLVVPVGAQGTYNVSFFDNPNFTLLNSCPGPQIPNLTRTAGQITIAGACCMSDGTCEQLSESECTSDGGAFSATSCGVDTDNDGVFDVCDPCPIDNPDDTDGDGTCDSDDGCPTDPNKVSPGQCGCGDSDSDGDRDGVPDCLDICPGISDAAFAPECIEPVPAVSIWGLVVLSLILLVGVTMLLRRQERERDIVET